MAGRPRSRDNKYFACGEPQYYDKCKYGKKGKWGFLCTWTIPGCYQKDLEDKKKKGTYNKWKKWDWITNNGSI